jgi:hypothetical protein
MQNSEHNIEWKGLHSFTITFVHVGLLGILPWTRYILFFNAWLSLWHWRWRQYVPPKLQWTSTTQHHTSEDNDLSYCHENLKSHQPVIMLVLIRQVAMLTVTPKLLKHGNVTLMADIFAICHCTPLKFPSQWVILWQKIFHSSLLSFLHVLSLYQMSTISLLSFVYLSLPGLSIYIFSFQWLSVEYLLSACGMGSFPGVKKQEYEADQSPRLGMWGG